MINLLATSNQIKLINQEQEFSEFFKPGFGTLESTTVTLYIKQNSTPCFMKSKLVPLMIWLNVEAELDGMVATFVIKPVFFFLRKLFPYYLSFKEEWSSPNF